MNESPHVQQKPFPALGLEETHTQYLTPDVGAIAFNQDRHVTASTVVKEGQEVPGPFQRTKRPLVLSEAVSWPLYASTRIT